MNGRCAATVTAEQNLSEIRLGNVVELVCGKMFSPKTIVTVYNNHEGEQLCM